MYYQAEPSVIAEIERRFRINEEILRFITIKYESKREVIAWEKLVQKANTLGEAPKEEEAAAAEAEAPEAKEE